MATGRTRAQSLAAYCIKYANSDGGMSAKKAENIAAELLRLDATEQELERITRASEQVPAAALATSDPEGHRQAIADHEAERAALPEPVLLPLPEWSKMDNLGGLVPSEIRQSLSAYAYENVLADRKARGELA